MRDAFFVWRATSTSRPSPAIYFDNPPGDGDRKYGPRILAEHTITGELLRLVNEAEGGSHFAALAAAFPPPVEVETA